MKNELELLREQIDELDDHLLKIIKERIILMQAIGKAKKNLEKAVRDSQREQEKIESLTKKSEGLGIPVNLVVKIWKLFFEISQEIER